MRQKQATVVTATENWDTQGGMRIQLSLFPLNEQNFEKPEKLEVVMDDSTVVEMVKAFRAVATRRSIRHEQLKLDLGL